jgi:hypothetical protein
VGILLESKTFLAVEMAEVPKNLCRSAEVAECLCRSAGVAEYLWKRDQIS